MKKIFYITGALLFAFVLVCFLRFFVDNFLANNHKFNEITFAPSQVALERFSGGLKIKTISNDVYNKTDFTEFDNFIAYIKKEYPLIFQKCEFKPVNGYNIVLKLKGQNSELQPNILLGHYDVVGVVQSKNWLYPPFSGHFDEDYIYSRGTIDDKASVFAMFEALEDLLKGGFQPKADLYVALSHSEETGSVEGAPKIIEYFKDNNISFKTALDEGGRIIDRNSYICAFVGTAQKGRLLSKVTVFGKGSHASMPEKNPAVVKLAKIINKFNNFSRINISDEIKDYYKVIYKSYDLPTRFLISNMDILKPVFVWKISQSPDDRARICTTYAVTVIKTSDIPNAISPEASLLIDARILPGETVSETKQYIQRTITKLLPDDEVEIEYLDEVEPSLSAGTKSEEFKNFSDVIKKVYPDITISPYLVLGVTDASEYNDITKATFCFLPCVLKSEEAELMHCDNERISVKNFGRMISFYKEYILTK